MNVEQPFLGEFIARKRRAAGHSLRSLEAEIGVRRNVIWQVERGRDVQLSTLNKILTAIGLNLEIK